MGLQQLVMHVDMDAFFAAIEQRDHKEYRGKPLIVGGLGKRGVVSTCSYEARKFGVHSAMPMVRARELCPQGIFVTGNYPLYRQVSQQVFAIFAKYSPTVEGLSIDEAFLDLTGMELLMQSPRDYALKLKREIFAKTGLIASVGIAPTKFLAKIASDLQKPNGLVIVPPDQVQQVLDPLSVGRIWGVGKKTMQVLASMRIRTIRDLRQTPKARLVRHLGERMAQHLSELSRGIDHRRVTAEREIKSIGREETFPDDLMTQAEAEQELLALSQDVAYRLRKNALKGRTIQLKLRLGNFQTYTRSKTLPDATCYDEDIYQTARDLYRNMHITKGIRLLGVSVSGFARLQELSLFGDQKKQENLYRAVDQIKARFGMDGITKAKLLRRTQDKK